MFRRNISSFPNYTAVQPKIPHFSPKYHVKSDDSRNILVVVDSQMRHDYFGCKRGPSTVRETDLEQHSIQVSRI